MIEQLRCTTIGAILALIVAGLFNIVYYLTLILIGSKEYALNLGCVAVFIILAGVIIDALRSINWHRDKVPPESDLIPKGFKTTQPEQEEQKDVLTNEQFVQKLRQLELEPTTE